MLTEGVIIINKKLEIMSKSLLFAIDNEKLEVIISESEQGSNEIKPIERIRKNDNEVLFNAVVTLTSISRSDDFDLKTFKAMQKVCEMIYQI